MDISPANDRLSLPKLQYNRGNVLIKLGHEMHDWLVVHDHILSTASPVLDTVFSKKWEKTIGLDRVKHPRNGRNVTVKILALKYAEGAYFLEGKEVLEDLDHAGRLFQDTAWSTDWPKSQVGPEGTGPGSVAKITKRAFRVLITAMYGMQLTPEQVAGCEYQSWGRLEDLDTSAWINETLFPQVVTVCAIAEYLQCLETVGPAMLAILQSAPRYWQVVAYESLQHMWFAMKLRDRELFYDAYRHAVVQAYYRVDNVNWQMISTVTGSTGDHHQAYYTR